MSIYYPPPSSLPPGSVVVAYLRDSGGTKQEDSIERQEEELRRWCLTYSLELAAIYTDAARTARKDLHRRKDLLSMMQHFRDGGAEAGIIIWNYERFSRNIKHGRAFIAELESLDKVLVSLTDNIPEGPEHYLFQEIKLYSAQMTSAKISVDVTSGLRRLVEVHGAMPGTPPRGFIRGPALEVGTHRDGTPRIVHRWEPDPERVHQVRMAFEMRARGSTYREIHAATRLYNSVNCWKTFFNNPIYKGVLEFGDLVIDDYCDPIVDADTWEAVQIINHKRGIVREGSHNPKRLVSHGLLSGLVYCQHCGAPMSVTSIKQWYYYVCTRHVRRHDCPARRIPFEALETGIIRALLDQILTLENLLMVQARLETAYQRVKSSSLDHKIDLNRQLKANKREISNLVTAVKSGQYSKALLDALAEAERREGELAFQLRMLDAGNQKPDHFEAPTLAQMAAHITAALTGEDQDEKRAQLHGLISRIIVRRTNAMIEGVMYYVPPQSKKKFPERELGNGRSAPTEARGDYLIPIFIPVKKHKAPLQF